MLGAFTAKHWRRRGCINITSGEQSLKNPHSPHSMNSPLSLINAINHMFFLSVWAWEISSYLICTSEHKCCEIIFWNIFFSAIRRHFRGIFISHTLNVFVTHIVASSSWWHVLHACYCLRSWRPETRSKLSSSWPVLCPVLSHRLYIVWFLINYTAQSGPCCSCSSTPPEQILD